MRPTPRACRCPRTQSREAVYGMPYEEWKAKHQNEASPAQKAAFEKSHKH